ncbi:hypothetical protein GCM10023317_33090 [Actinopolymorpha pittospori]
MSTSSIRGAGSIRSSALADRTPRVRFAVLRVAPGITHLRRTTTPLGDPVGARGRDHGPERGAKDDPSLAGWANPEFAD